MNLWKKIALIFLFACIPVLMAQVSGPTTRTPRLTVGPGDLIVDGNATFNGISNTFTDTILAFSVRSPDGGNLQINGGLPLPLTTGTGNILEIVGGQGGSTSGPGGEVVVEGGSTTDGNGGGFSVLAADGVGTNRNGGNITLTSGARTGSGVQGLITLAHSTGTLFSFNSAGAILIAGSAAGTAGQVFSSGGSAAATSWINISLSGTSASLGGGALAQGACASNTTTVTGATTSMVAMASPNTYPGDGNVWSAQVTAADTVTTRICAIVAATPTASTYNIRILR